MERIISSLIGVLDHPDAERPYLGLAKAYGESGMREEEEAVLFLIEKRFGGKDARRADPHKEQREDDCQDLGVPDGA